MKINVCTIIAMFVVLTASPAAAVIEDVKSWPQTYDRSNYIVDDGTTYYFILRTLDDTHLVRTYVPIDEFTSTFSYDIISDWFDASNNSLGIHNVTSSSEKIDWTWVVSGWESSITNATSYVIPHDGGAYELISFANRHVTIGPTDPASEPAGMPWEVIVSSHAMTHDPSEIPVLAPTPEPTSWALMIVGFGMVGAGMRMRAAAGRLGAEPRTV